MRTSTLKFVEETISYETRSLFLGKYTQYILYLEQNDIKGYLTPLIDNFSLCRYIPELFTEFITSELCVNKPDNFWHVWELFKDKVVDTSINNASRSDTNKIIESYMFAHITFMRNLKECSIFSQERGMFFSDLSQKLSGDASYLYSLAKLLDGAGNIYLKDGIGILWLSCVIKNHEINLSKDYRENITYSLEEIIRKYMSTNKEEVMESAKIKSAITIILNFLINNGSSFGYKILEKIS